MRDGEWEGWETVDWQQRALWDLACTTAERWNKWGYEPGDIIDLVILNWEQTNSQTVADLIESCGEWEEQ